MKTELVWRERVVAAAQVDTLVAVIAYAEAVAIPWAGLGVMLGSPEALAARALDDTLAGRAPWAAATGLREHLQEQIRRRFRHAVEAEARARGLPHTPWAARLSSAQVGDLDGLEEVVHHAGVAAYSFRRADREVRACAMRLAASVAARAPGDGADDTAPIPRSVFVDVTLGGGEGAN